MAKNTFTIGSRTLVPGTLVVGPFTVQAARGEYYILIDVTQHMNPGVNVMIDVEVSYDGGVTWEFVTSSGRGGGTAYEDGGVVSTSMGITVGLDPEQGNRRRQIRSHVTVEGGSFVTAGATVEIRDVA